MTKIDFPRVLNALLEDSAFLAPLRNLADRVGVLLFDNKLAFFPDYTDHGVSHITNVLKSMAELVPASVWSQSTRGSDPQLLNDADATVIVAAALLHDLA